MIYHLIPRPLSSLGLHALRRKTSLTSDYIWWCWCCRPGQTSPWAKHCWWTRVETPLGPLLSPCKSATLLFCTICAWFFRGQKLCCWTVGHLWCLRHIQELPYETPWWKGMAGLEAEGRATSTRRFWHKAVVWVNEKRQWATRVRVWALESSKPGFFILPLLFL